MTTINLNASWQFSVTDKTANTLPDTVKWLPAVVPGDANGDLADNGILPDPLISDNFKKGDIFRG